MRNRVFLLLCGALLAATPLFAFDGGEHRDLTNLALRLALGTYQQPGSDEIRNTALELLNGPKNETFGDVTSAVDSVYRREHLAGSTTALPTMRTRPHQPFQHLLAIHRNFRHFQGYALEDYDAFHAKALLDAHLKNALDALLSEATALHFLEDAFAAGHIVTPRAGFRNAVAGSLHDKFSVDGFLVTVFRHVPDDDKQAWRALLADVDRFVASVSKESICIRKNDADSIKDLLENGGTVKFVGDGGLDAATQQKLVLLLVAARSIREVLDAAAQSQLPVRSMRACYTPRSVAVDARGNPFIHSFRGPVGGITIGPVRDVEEGDVNVEPSLDHCDEPGVLGYIVDEAEMKSGGLTSLPFKDSLYEFPAFRLTALVGASKNGSSRKSIDLGYVFGAEDPVGSVHLRDGQEHITDDRYRDYLSLAAIAMYASFTRGPHYKAIGGHAEYELPLPVRAASFALRWGFRRYNSDEKRFYRFDYGGKAMVGIEVANLTVAVDRGRRIRPDGSVAADTFLMFGLELTGSKGWVKKMWPKTKTVRACE